MYQFQKDISAFISEMLSGELVKYHANNSRLIEMSLLNANKRFMIVFHYLDDEPHAHLDKIRTFTSNAEKRVVHLWEDQWIFHQEKIHSRLMSLLGKSERIHGRETKIHNLNNNQLLAFLHKNHLNVPIKAKYKYGLFINDDLLAAISFSKGRPMKRDGITYNSFELLRYCNKLNCTVVGGFSKLLNYFIKEISPEDVMTYVDKDWSDGSTYTKAGFVLEDQLSPMQFILDQSSGKRLYAGNDDSLKVKSGLKVYNSGSYKFIKYLK